MAENKNARQFKCYVCGRKFNSLPELIRHDLRLEKRPKQ